MGNGDRPKITTFGVISKAKNAERRYKHLFSIKFFILWTHNRSDAQFVKNGYYPQKEPKRP
jgi:hypothetical protein